MKILKFGGSSIRDAERIKNVIDIVKNAVVICGQEKYVEMLKNVTIF